MRELKATGGDEHTAVLRVASRWYSGNANLYTSTRYRQNNRQMLRSLSQNCINPHIQGLLEDRLIQKQQRTECLVMPQRSETLVYPALGH